VIGPRITEVDASRTSFSNSFKKLSDEQKAEAAAAIADILRQPIPALRRFKSLTGYANPKIYTVHVTRNHSHKLSFELEGTVAVLRRIGTHKEIDRTP
jgi:hypothetical protein